MSDTSVWLLGAGLVAGIAAGLVAYVMHRDRQIIEKYRADKMAKPYRQDDKEDIHS